MVNLLMELMVWSHCISKVGHGWIYCKGDDSLSNKNDSIVILLEKQGFFGIFSISPLLFNPAREGRERGDTWKISIRWEDMQRFEILSAIPNANVLQVWPHQTRDSAYWWKVISSSSTKVPNIIESGISRFLNPIELNSDLFELNYSKFDTHDSELGNYGGDQV